MSMTTGQMEEWINHQIKTSWQQSDEKKQVEKRQKYYWLVGLSIIALCGVGMYVSTNHTEPSELRYPWLGITAFFAIFAGPLILYAAYQEKVSAAKKIAEDRVRQFRAADLREEERKFAAAAGESQSVDVATLWALNQKRIDFYHDIAISQSRNSFRSGQVATIAGFVGVIILGGIAASTSGASAISVGVVGVAGAALSGYIGATFMKAQSEASAQLRQFFAQPVEFARLLGAERLLEALAPRDKAAALNTIIKATMQVPGGDASSGVPAKAADAGQVAKPKKRWPWSR